MIISQITGLVAGIGWEPEIRGLLTVALAGVALVGTVWLLLVTNTGVRLGSLIALAGLFGWFTIMATVWWLFGIGYSGDTPTWEYLDSFEDKAGAETAGIEDAFIGDVSDLLDPNCDSRQVFPPSKTGWTFSPPAPGCLPKAMALVMEYDGPDKASVLEELATVDGEAIRQGVEEQNSLRSPNDPRLLDDAGLESEVARLVAREETKLDQLSLSALEATAPSVIEWAVDVGYLDLRDWMLLSTTQSGEATNFASSILTETGAFPEDAAAATPAFIIVDSFQKGGKPLAKSDGLWDRVTNKITNSARLAHPTNYVVVQARAAVPKPQEPGQPTPLAEIDKDSSTISVVLQRDLGNRRLVPGLIAVGSGLIFIAIILSLHMRDRRLVFSRKEDSAEASVGAAAGAI